MINNSKISIGLQSKTKYMLKKALFLSLLCIYTLKSFSQVPTTDIYLLDMNVKHGKYIFSNAQKISDWKGYNNQPYFTPDGKSIYYVSYRGKQSDIYMYDIKSKINVQFTNTPEDEYSPKLTPDGKSISVVRVMKDSAQQLWAFPIKGGTPRHLLKGSDSIGYYTWQKNFVVTANVPEPMKLEIKDTTGSVNSTVIKNIGRSLQALTNKHCLFVQQTANKKDSINWICLLFNQAQSVQLVATLPNSEDFTLGPKFTLYAGKNGKLYKYRIGKDKEWIEIADFSNTEYKNFYRIAINKKGNKIALVSYFGKKP